MRVAPGPGEVEPGLVVVKSDRSCKKWTRGRTAAPGFYLERQPGLRARPGLPEATRGSCELPELRETSRGLRQAEAEHQ